jgi:hypothetical protein
MPSVDGGRGGRRYTLSSDAGVGEFDPEDIREVSFPRVSVHHFDALGRFAGLTSTASDVLDELGWKLSLAASTIPPRHTAGGSVIGHALTLKYLPERHHLQHRNLDDGVPKLAHQVVFRSAHPGDVLVVDAAGCGEVSVMGGLAAASAVRVGIAAAIVDGATFRKFGRVASRPGRDTSLPSPAKSGSRPFRSTHRFSVPGCRFAQEMS